MTAQHTQTIPQLHQNGTLVISDDNTFCLEQNHKYTNANGTHDVPEHLQLERAALIVRAVNSHEALVKCLRSAMFAAVERHQDVYVADACLKGGISYVREYARDYDFKWPQHIYDGFEALKLAEAE